LGKCATSSQSSPYFHIGGDESYWYNFEQTSDYKELMKRKRLQGHGRSLAEFLTAWGTKIQEARAKNNLLEGFNPSRAVDKDIIVMAWGGDMKR